MTEPCPFHVDHENRIKVLEDQMETVQNERVSGSRWVAFLGFVGVLATGAFSLVGTIVGFYGKSQGWW